MNTCISFFVFFQQGLVLQINALADIMHSNLGKTDHKW